jgi:hypothetical protein
MKKRKKANLSDKKRSVCGFINASEADQKANIALCKRIS